MIQDILVFSRIIKKVGSKDKKKKINIQGDTARQVNENTLNFRLRDCHKKKKKKKRERGINAVFSRIYRNEFSSKESLRKSREDRAMKERIYLTCILENIFDCSNENRPDKKVIICLDLSKERFTRQIHVNTKRHGDIQLNSKYANTRSLNDR